MGAEHKILANALIFIGLWIHSCQLSNSKPKVSIFTKQVTMPRKRYETNIYWEKHRFTGKVVRLTPACVCRTVTLITTKPFYYRLFVCCIVHAPFNAFEYSWSVWFPTAYGTTRGLKDIYDIHTHSIYVHILYSMFIGVKSSEMSAACVKQSVRRFQQFAFVRPRKHFYVGFFSCFFVILRAFPSLFCLVAILQALPRRRLTLQCWQLTNSSNITMPTTLMVMASSDVYCNSRRTSEKRRMLYIFRIVCLNPLRIQLALASEMTLLGLKFPLNKNYLQLINFVY